jgi:hypothetical protein
LTGRPAPGALPLGPTRPEDIEGALQEYAVAWTFDDQRLTHQVKSLLEKTLAGDYPVPEALREDLIQAFYDNQFAE